MTPLDVGACRSLPCCASRSSPSAPEGQTVLIPGLAISLP